MDQFIIRQLQIFRDFRDVRRFINLVFDQLRTSLHADRSHIVGKAAALTDAFGHHPRQHERPLAGRAFDIALLSQVNQSFVDGQPADIKLFAQLFFSFDLIARL